MNQPSGPTRECGSTSRTISVRGVRILSSIVAAIGAIWLAAWTIGIPQRLASTRIITMKSNMALGLLLSGVALVVLRPFAPATWRRVTGGSLGLVVFLIGALTTCEHFFRRNLGIDQLLFTEPAGAPGILSPNRMGPPGALSLTFLGLALLALAGRKRGLPSHFGVLVCAISLVPAVGYLYSARAFFGNAYLTGIAWPTIPALMFLGIALILSCDDSGLMSVLLRRDAGGSLLRHLLPATILIPLVLGFIRRRGETAGWYGPATGTALLVVTLIVVFSALLWLSALRVSNLEATRTASHDALMQSESRLKALLDSLPLAVWFANPDGQLIIANRAAREIFGHAPLVALTDYKQYQAWWPDSGKQLESRDWALAQAILTGQPVRHDLLEIQAFDGTRKLVRNIGFPVRGPNQENYGGAAVMENITESKARERALHESEHRFRMVAENVPEILWVADANSNFSYLSPKWFDYTGTSVEQNANLGWTEVIHPEDRAGALEAWTAAARTNRVYQTEYRLRRSDGEYRWHMARAIPVQDPSSAQTFWFGMTTDVEDQIQAQQALLRTEKLASAGRMAATVAHEINNPLETITNLLFLLRKEVASERGRQQLAAAEAQLTQVGQITKQTLAFYRESSKPTACDLANLIDDALRTHAAKLDQNRIVTEKSCDSVSEVEALQGELRQVFSNLIANAIDAMPEGGILGISMHPFGDDAQRGVEVQVRDTGAGIAESDKAKIFEPFYTTKQDVGNGLGLWVVNEILKRHGATVEVSSSTESDRHGTCFSVRIPAKWEFRLV